jgi:hypothetical protein
MPGEECGDESERSLTIYMCVGRGYPSFDSSFYRGRVVIYNRKADAREDMKRRLRAEPTLIVAVRNRPTDKHEGLCVTGADQILRLFDDVDSDGGWWCAWEWIFTHDIDVARRFARVKVA